MNDEFNSLRPYSFKLDGDMHYVFTTDIRISHTIVKILSLFFANHQNSMIMVCDSVDGREHKRSLLFDRWFRNYATADINKYDASAETEDYVLYVSLFIHKDNSRKSEIVSAFYELVRNNMYPID